ncbi:MAG: hypothetical protein R2704_16365 [Microthrixaceae bacterium]
MDDRPGRVITSMRRSVPPLTGIDGSRIERNAQKVAEGGHRRRRARTPAPTHAAVR